MKKHKASILVVTLFILGIIITTALAVSLAAIKQRNASLGSGKSTKAFQNADAGVEFIINEINNGAFRTVAGMCNKASGAGYDIKFYDKDGKEMSCDGTSKFEIASIKSIGMGDDQQTRAIEAVAAATTLEWESLDTDWSDFGSNRQTLGYARDNRTGLVYLRGSIKSGSCSGSSCDIANLPDGFRPKDAVSVFSQYGKSPSSTNYSWKVEVLSGSNGLIRVAPISSAFPTDQLSLDGIVFPTN